MAREQRHCGRCAALEARHSGVGGAWDGRQGCHRGVQAVSTASGASSLCGRGVTAAWNWRRVLVNTLGFVLVEILFWLVVSLSTVLKNLVSLYTRLKQIENCSSTASGTRAGGCHRSVGECRVRAQPTMWQRDPEPPRPRQRRHLQPFCTAPLSAPAAPAPRRRRCIATARQ